MLTKQNFFILPSILLLLLGGYKNYGQKTNSITNSIESIDIILLIDCSPSTKYTDPYNLRISAARYLLDYLNSTAEIAAVNYRAGVANFGNELGEIIPLKPLLGGELSKSIHKEVIPFTDFRPPLEFARNEFRENSDRSYNRQILILFTDGSPQLTNKILSIDEKKQYFSGEELETDSTRYRTQKLNLIVQELKEMTVELIVIAIGDASKDAQLWQDLIPKKNYISISRISELTEVYHKLGAKISKLSTPTTKKYENELLDKVLIQPYLVKIVFTFLKNNKSVQIDLYSPLGECLEPISGGTPEDLYEIYYVHEPEWEKPWQIKIMGDGAKLEINQLLPKIESWRKPSENIQLGETVTVFARLKRGKKVVVDSKLQLKAKINDIMKEWKVLNNIGEGKYQVKFEKLKQSGNYASQIKAFFNNKPLEADFSELKFEVHETIPVGKWSIFEIIIFVLLIIFMVAFFYTFYRYKIFKKDKVDTKAQIEEDDSKVPKGEEKQYGKAQTAEDEDSQVIKTHQTESTLLEDQKNEFEKIIALKEEGLALFESNNKKAAIEKFQLAIESLNEYSSLGETYASKELEALIQIIIEKPLEEDLEKQREFIYRQLQDDVPMWKIMGIARVLFNRWLCRSDYIQDELFEICSQSKGLDVIEEISKIEIISDWGKKKVEQGKKIVNLAQSYKKLRKKI